MTKLILFFIFVIIATVCRAEEPEERPDFTCPEGEHLIIFIDPYNPTVGIPGCAPIVEGSRNHVVVRTTSGVLWLVATEEITDIYVLHEDGWEADVAVVDAHRTGKFDVIFAAGAPLGNYEVYINGRLAVRFVLFDSDPVPMASVTWIDNELIQPDAYAPFWAFAASG